jgi:uncharacterized protein
MFNDNKRLDPSQIEDRRGRSPGRTIALGGGGLGIIALIIYMLLGGNPADLAGANAADQSSSAGSNQEAGALISECQTGADANKRQDCRLVGFVNSIQAFWEGELVGQGVKYSPAQTVLFSESTQGACGFASSASGPFYCPSDRTIYVDLSFFDTVLKQIGAQGGPLAEAYVLAHEYGHHVQNLFGLLDSSAMNQATGPDSQTVFSELQADCLAGIWLNHATGTGYITKMTREDLIQALNAAASVGDDRIQKQTQGYIVPEAWTHGSSEQRLAALQDGLQSGDLNTCNTPGWTK